MTSTAEPAAIDPVEAGRALLDVGVKAARAYGRPDLADRLQRIRDGLDDPEVRVLFVGEYKQGKSSLLNALLGADVSPVDDDIATAIPLAVRWSPTPRAEAVRTPEAGDEPEREPLELAEVAGRVTENAGADDARPRPTLVQVGVPAPLLEGGLVLVDTPGVGGLGSTHGAITAAAIPTADAVVFVADACQELSAAEVAFLTTVRRLCPTIRYALAKTDLSGAWRRIAELDRGHLHAASLPIEITPVSATLARAGQAAGDPTLLDESGVPALTAWLLDEVQGRADRRAARRAATEVRAAVEQLAAPFESERAALLDPARRDRLLADLDEARARADRLRGAASRWQQGLGDGFADVTSDVDHDLRVRLREVTQEAEEALERSDPAQSWPEFETWLLQRTSAAVTATYALLHERATALAVRLGEEFDVDEKGVRDALALEAPARAMADRSLAPLQARRQSPAGMALSALRGGYSGSMLFGMLGGLAGVALAPPVAVVAMAAFGTKTVRDERQRQLAQRRAQAKTAARRYVDEVTFAVNKELRDALRHTQRTIREQLTARAEEIHVAAQRALAAAQSAAAQGEVGTPARVADVDAELRRLGGLAERARLLEDAAAAVGSGS